MKWYLDVLKKYAVFSGRARRKEYWMFQLFNALVMLVLGIITMSMAGGDSSPVFMIVLMALYSLFILLPSLGVTIRRLHDVGKSGAWIFIVLVPIIGEIWFFILLLTGGQPGVNQYGVNPKEGGTAE